MGFLDSFHHRMEFFLLRHINRIFHIHADHRLIGGNFDDIHAVNIAELLLFCQRRTGHTGFLLIFIEEILEGNSSQSLTLPSHLHMLLGLNGLMESVGIAAARHDTPRKLIDDQHLIIFDHIVLIPEHQIVCPQRQDDIVLDFQIFRICQVFNIKKLLYFLYTLLCQVNDFILFIDNEISGFRDLLAHDGGHLRHLAASFAPFQLACQDIADLIEFCGFPALAGNDQRRSRLVDQYGVHLVDDGVVQISLYQLFFVDHHVITKIIKSQLIVGHVGNVAGIGRPALVAFHGIEHNAHGQSQKFMNLSHPLSITVSQIIIDRHNVDALAFQRIQISRKSRHQRLSFTGFHLRNPSLMQNDTADQLYPVMLHVQHTSGRFSDGRISLHQNIVQGGSPRQTLFEFFCLVSQFAVAERLHGRS